MKPSIKYLLFVAILGILSVSCEKIQEIGDSIIIQTDREQYEQNFHKEDSLYNRWSSQFTQSINDSLKIDLPFYVQGNFLSNRNEVLSYDLYVKEGQRLVVERLKVNDSGKVFVDLLETSQGDLGEKSKIFEGVLNSNRNMVFKNGANKYVKLLIQPEIYLDSPFMFKIYTEPIYAFPVSGHTNNSVGSFWGDTRDGGRRSHKGVDIFAERGTPVIAITKGRVRKTGDYGLGGKQVWIRDSKRGNSLYYAHLDSIAISNGVKVAIGDTLGFVGNTGNARTTAPHLHFGIYRRFVGAIDPLPFIKPSPLLDVQEETSFTKASLNNMPSNIRMGPNTKYEKILTLSEPTEIEILGKTHEWYHIILPQGQNGFIHQSLVKATL